ncbi:MAG: hypothetical protein Q9169_008132 [Polycauliona sp. 2 TL-2023]
MLDPDDIKYPMEWFIKLPTTQKWIYDHMFSSDNVKILPYPPYAYRILKRLMSVLEAAMDDPEEDEISDDLANCFAEMLSKKGKNEIDAMQEKRPVTYTAPVLGCNPPTIIILEAPNLLASNGDTGNRTWDAALVLATFLFTEGRHFVQDASVLELGAGLGFVSVFCGKHLGAKHVLVTDASEAVLSTAQQNAELNDVSSIVKTSVLRWGTPDLDRILQNGNDAISFDLILGADMLYEPRDFPALTSTLKDLFAHSPKLQVLISSALRREETLESFLDDCNLPFIPPNMHKISFYNINKAKAVEGHGREWLQSKGIDLDSLLDGPLDRLLHAHLSFFTTSIPELVSLDPSDETAVWVLPFSVNAEPGSAAGQAVLLVALDYAISGYRSSGYLWGDCLTTDLGGFYVKLPIHRQDSEDILIRGAFPAGFKKLGKENDRPERIDQLPETHVGIVGRVGNNSMGTHSSALASRVPTPSSRHIDGSTAYSTNRGMVGGINRGMSRGMDHGIDRGMDRGMDPDMSRVMGPTTRRRPNHYQPMGYTGGIIASSSSEDTSTESDSSESEPDAPKRSTKKKTKKGTSKIKSEGKNKKKPQRRKESSTESSEEDEPPRKPKKSKNAKPKGKAPRRGRSPSDDEIAYSDDEQPKKGKGKAAARKAKPEGESHGPPKRKAIEAPKQQAGRRARGRSPSDDEGQAPPSASKGGPSEARPRAGGAGKLPEKKAPGPLNEKAVTMPGPSQPQDEAPPRVDPAEEAILKRLKAQNGYGDEKPEKSGWH